MNGVQMQAVPQHAMEIEELDGLPPDRGIQAGPRPGDGEDSGLQQIRHVWQQLTYVSIRINRAAKQNVRVNAALLFLFFLLLTLGVVLGVVAGVSSSECTCTNEAHTILGDCDQDSIRVCSLHVDRLVGLLVPCVIVLVLAVLLRCLIPNRRRLRKALDARAVEVEEMEAAGLGLPVLLGFRIAKRCSQVQPLQ